MKGRSAFLIIAAVFLAFYFMPMGSEVINNAILSGFQLLHEYTQQHVLTCLVPAFFIAGAISIFIKKEAVLKYLGKGANKHVSYSIASVSGAVLAVCSCTILPLFAGIRHRGAGLGPSITFLFSGPAINIAAIFLTFSVLGFEIGLARIFFAIILSILVGVSMSLIFREKQEGGEFFVQKSKDLRVSRKVLMAFFGLMVMVLVVNSLQIGFMFKYAIMGSFAVGVALIALFKFTREASMEWLTETWNFSKLLIPYLFIGVFIAGFIMPLLPQEIIEGVVGSNSVFGNLAASVFGAFMYFSTLTEIPILQALMAKGMHSGPALALLLAGPSLSLPNMLVIRRVLGTKKTSVYAVLVIVYATIAGLIFGSL
jgi:uncharacterized membrane protein YraQ (UPF0718 family)